MLLSQNKNIFPFALRKKLKIYTPILRLRLKEIKSTSEEYSTCHNITTWEKNEDFWEKIKKGNKKERKKMAHTG